MRTSPVLIALLVGLAGLAVGPVAATPSAGDGQPGQLAAQSQAHEQPSNASIDSLTLKNVSGTFSVDGLVVDRIETKQGTAENVSLDDATVTLDNATVVVGEVSSENRTKPNATASIVEGEVTIEDANATVNGQEFHIAEESFTIENGSVTSDAVSERDTQDLPDVREIEVTRDELERMIEGATMEGLSLSAKSDGLTGQAVFLHGVQVDEHSGGAILGSTELQSFDVDVSAEEVRIEDGMLILEEATVDVKEAQLLVGTGIVERDESVIGLNDEVFRIEDSFSVDRFAIKLERS